MNYVNMPLYFECEREGPPERAFEIDTREDFS